MCVSVWAYVNSLVLMRNWLETPGWSTSWMAAANRAARISRSVKTAWNDKKGRRQKSIPLTVSKLVSVLIKCKKVRLIAKNILQLKNMDKRFYCLCRRDHTAAKCETVWDKIISNLNNKHTQTLRTEFVCVCVCLLFVVFLLPFAAVFLESYFPFLPLKTV